MKSTGRSLVEGVESAVRSGLRGAGVLQAGDTVVVAVSGGTDSLCLLYALHRLSAELQLSLHVAHLDHMLRGAESQEDARFVSSRAESLGLLCTVESRDVAAYRDAHHCSLEEAAREVRYSFLREVAHRVNAVAVVTGHTRDDAVETVMLHILRGTGVHGLRGLEPASPYPYSPQDGVDKRALTLLRPMLQVSRSEAEGYCRALGLEPREDATNASLAYLRNRIRLELLPSMRQLNPRVDDALLRLSGLAAEDDEYLVSIARGLWERIATNAKDRIDIEASAFLESSPALQSRLIFEAMVQLTGTARDVTAEHIAAVRDIAAHACGRQVDLPGGIIWRRDHLALTAFRRSCAVDATRSLMPESPAELNVPGEVVVAGGRVTARLTAPGGGETDSPCVAHVDVELTGKRLFVRRRTPGDRFRPLGMAGEKKLQDFMVDAHIPSHARDRIPIVCSSSHIVWVAGWRVDDRVKVTAGTRDVLRLEFLREG
jgi:tRNA(Ile)-lysidine synthase